MLYSGCSDEAKLLKKIKSPYIVRYEDFFADFINFYIITEYCNVNKSIFIIFLYIFKFFLKKREVI